MLNLSESHGDDAREPLSWLSPILWIGSFPTSGSGALRHRTKQTLRQVPEERSNRNAARMPFLRQNPHFEKTTYRDLAMKVRQYSRVSVGYLRERS